METFFVPQEHFVTHRLSSLSPEIQQVVKSKKLSFHQSIARCQEQLTELSLYGQAVEKAQKKHLNVLMFGVLLTFISIFGAIFVPAFSLFLGVGVIAIIVGAILYSRYPNAKLPTFIKEFLLPLLSVLEQENGPEAIVQIEAELHETLQEQHLLRKTLHSTQNYPKTDTFWYERTLLRLQAELSKNTHLQLEISELIRERKVTKRNIRGKIKVKQKHKIRVNYEAKVSLPSKYYELQALSASSRHLRLKHKPGEKRQQIQVSLRHTHQQLHASPQLALAVQAIGEAYKQVKAV
jgi:hypothetical protein